MLLKLNILSLFFLIVQSVDLRAEIEPDNYKNFSKTEIRNLYVDSCEFYKLQICMNVNLKISKCDDPTQQYNCLNPKDCNLGQLHNCYQLAVLYQEMSESISEYKDDLLYDKFLNSQRKDEEKNGKIKKKIKTSPEAPQERAIRIFKLACAAGSKNSCAKLESIHETGSKILFWGGIFLIGFAVFYLSHTIFKDEDEYRVQHKLSKDSLSDTKKQEKKGIIFEFSKPLFKRYLSPIVANMKSSKNLKKKYKQPLACAGLTEHLTVEDFYAFKLFLILGFPMTFMGLRNFLELDWPLKLIPIVSIGGYFYPNMWVMGCITQRQKAIIMAMPFSIDMLALSVEAGLDFIMAMGKVVEKAKPTPLNDEFTILLREINLGASRADALRNMSWRIDLIQVSSFCATLIAADSVGASIGPILKNLSKEIREKRSSQIEKAGATAATKILFPMMFLIIPSVFLIVAAPMILQFITEKK